MKKILKNVIYSFLLFYEYLICARIAFDIIRFSIIRRNKPDPHSGFFLSYVSSVKVNCNIEPFRPPLYICR